MQWEKGAEGKERRGREQASENGEKKKREQQQEGKKLERRESTSRKGEGKKTDACGIFLLEAQHVLQEDTRAGTRQGRAKRMPKEAKP